MAKTSFTKSDFADASPFDNRVFEINEDILNPISSRPVGLKLIPQPCRLLLAGPYSLVRRRARFAEHHLWVTRYRDGDLWAGGNWTNQSPEERDGLVDYAARYEDVRADIVVWHTFGMAHNPRVEDFPMMPVEISTNTLRPADFFTANPALDVPQSIQKFNQSVQVEDERPCESPAIEKGAAKL